MGISPRRLAYWASAGLVAPSVRSAAGPRRYAFQDLVALRTVKRLTEADIPLEQIRDGVGALRRSLPGVRRPLSELALVARGGAIVALRRGAALEVRAGGPTTTSTAPSARGGARATGGSAHGARAEETRCE